MVLVKATKESEAGVMPTEQMLREMSDYNEKLVNAGIMRAAEGLQPSSRGKRVVFDGTTTRVIDGVVGKTEELVAGFWIWDVKSMDEAVAWARQCPSPMPNSRESALELRPIATTDDFGEAMTPELRTKEKKLAQQIERQNARP
jgi:hypothetical protein